MRAKHVARPQLDFGVLILFTKIIGWLVGCQRCLQWRPCHVLVGWLVGWLSEMPIVAPISRVVCQTQLQPVAPPAEGHELEGLSACDPAQGRDLPSVQEAVPRVWANRAQDLDAVSCTEGTWPYLRPDGFKMCSGGLPRLGIQRVAYRRIADEQ